MSKIEQSEPTDTLPIATRKVVLGEYTAGLSHGLQLF